MVEEIIEVINNPLLGFFESIEVIQIFGIMNENKKKRKKENSSEYFNIYTLMVASESQCIQSIKKEYITDSLTRLDNAKKIKIGILRHLFAKNDFIEYISNRLSNTNKDVEIYGFNNDKLNPLHKVFVPKNDMQEYDFKGILKNNFNGGSFVFEWFDVEKNKFIYDPNILSEISEKVQRYRPIKIGNFSDRVGNFVLQIPCLSVSIKLNKRNKHNHHFNIDIAVNPKLKATDLQFTGMFWREERGVFIDMWREKLTLGINEITFKQKNGSIHWLVFDDESGHVCSGGTTTSFIESFLTEIQIKGNERNFTIPADNETYEPKAIEIIDLDYDDKKVKDYRDWIHRRIYQNDKNVLHKNLKLIQFQGSEHDEALSKIRTLLSEHGKFGAYLWDPYLSAVDLLNTLFWCPYAGVELRALTGLKVTPNIHNVNSLDHYREVLEQHSGNRLGLNLTFLNAASSHKKFHDRFLIFPYHVSRPARVWSLGTSVNSLGKAHHIVQEVSDGQIIAATFEEYWNKSLSEGDIIWQCN